jgi:2-hydroxyacyl-CoA lyase
LNAALAGRQWFHPKDTPWRQMITKKAEENAAQIRPQIHDDEAPANYFRALRDVAAWMPKNAILSAEGAGTMDIGLTQLNVANARSCLNAGTYGTMGVGLGQAIAAAVAGHRRRSPAPGSHRTWRADFPHQRSSEVGSQHCERLQLRVWETQFKWQ